MHIFVHVLSFPVVCICVVRSRGRSRSVNDVEVIKDTTESSSTFSSPLAAFCLSTAFLTKRLRFESPGVNILVPMMFNYLQRWISRCVT